MNIIIIIINLGNKFSEIKFRSKKKNIFIFYFIFIFLTRNIHTLHKKIRWKMNMINDNNKFQKWWIFRNTDFDERKKYEYLLVKKYLYFIRNPPQSFFIIEENLDPRIYTMCPECPLILLFELIQFPQHQVLDRESAFRIYRVTHLFRRETNFAMGQSAIFARR